MNRIFLFFYFYFILNITVSGQVASNLDCIGATPVCVDMFNEDIVPANEGRFPNEINTSINCGGGPEIKAIWYIFTVNRSGDFGFLISPASPTADYDWSLFNLTNASCADIFDDPSLVVSCNAAGGPGCQGMTGASGATNFRIQGGSCGFNPPNASVEGAFNAFNDLIPVTAGNTYVLYVSNWNQEEGGYVIDFSLSGDIGIFDQESPTIEPLPTDQVCVVNEIPIQFSENIQCSTISIDNINIPGIASSEYRFYSEICDQGASFDDQFILEFNEPINTTGDYTIEFTPSVQLEMLDLCDNSLGDAALTFSVVNDMPGPMLEAVTPDDNCQINEVTVTFRDNILCSGLNSNSFTVIAPDGTILAGETILNGCDVSSEFIYRFDQPILENGEYELFLNSGQDLMFINECLKQLEGASSSVFSKVSADDAAVGTISISSECALSDIVIPFTRPIQCNTIENDNVQIEFMGSVLPGIISDTDCTDRGSLMLLTEITYTLDEPVSVSGSYQVNILSNGIDELVTDCGSSAMSFSQPFDLTLDINPPSITALNFAQDCNIQNLSIEFSEPVTCDNSISSGFSLIYNQEQIDITGVTNCDSQNATNSVVLNLTRAINADGNYLFSQTNPLSSITDACGSSPEPFNLTGDLTFDDCDSCFIYIPTAFSPNGDNINDEVGPLSNCAFAGVDFNVFDRWGNLVYADRGIDQVNIWNGFMNDNTVLPGVYAYVIEIQLTEFRTIATRTRRGTFTILD
jgi:gliding motility-associated-like protein